MFNPNRFRLTLWTKKTDSAKLSAKPPDLKSLPPTNEALELNILRAHFQAMIWNNCVSGCSPNEDPCLVSFKSFDPRMESQFSVLHTSKLFRCIFFQFGWGKDSETETLRPVMLPEGVEMAPEEVLKITRCNCSCRSF